MPGRRVAGGIRPALPVMVVGAAALLLGGCLVSQPIVVRFPRDAAWSFAYHDALGEALGGGRAKLTVEPGPKGDAPPSLQIVLTEEAFGDQARFRGTLGPESKDHPGWHPFTAQGTWFDGRPFAVKGCLKRNTGAVRPHALAHERTNAAAQDPRFESPCAGAPNTAPPTFGEAQLDAVFTWSARPRTLSSKEQ